MEVNGGCVPIQWERTDSSRKYPAFLVLNPAQVAGFLRNSLKLRRSFAIIGLEFHWNALGKVLKSAEMPLMKANGKSEFIRISKKPTFLGFETSIIIKVRVPESLDSLFSSNAKWESTKSKPRPKA
jgi:hypothetical protein